MVPQVFDHLLIDKVISEYNSTKHIYNFYHTKRQLNDLVANATHHTHVTAPSMWELIDNDIIEDFLRLIFNGPAILNTMGLSEVTKSGVYTQKIHRDVRTNTGPYPLWLNMLIMLDDCTEENGATAVREIQNKETAPEKEYFFKNASVPLGKRRFISF